jgi:hypothetical protein
MSFEHLKTLVYLEGSCIIFKYHFVGNNRRHSLNNTFHDYPKSQRNVVVPHVHTFTCTPPIQHVPTVVGVNVYYHLRYMLTYVILYSLHSTLQDAS